MIVTRTTSIEAFAHTFRYSLCTMNIALAVELSKCCYKEHRYFSVHCVKMHGVNKYCFLQTVLTMPLLVLFDTYHARKVWDVCEELQTFIQDSKEVLWSEVRFSVKKIPSEVPTHLQVVPPASEEQRSATFV